LYPLKGGACCENADEIRDRLLLNTTVSQYPDFSNLNIPTLAGKTGTAGVVICSNQRTGGPEGVIFIPWHWWSAEGAESAEDNNSAGARSRH
jgi:hypothetical protein